MAWQPTRDLIGYAGRPPDPRWPNGARLALNFVLNYEEGSEPSVQDGEGYSDYTLTDGHGPAPITQGRDLAAESMFEYGSRVGFWRILRLFQERNMPLTIFACALALERNPAAAAAIRAAGYDICCHGWRWIKHWELDEPTERDHIVRAVESLHRTIGRRPEGWYCRYGPSVNTRRLVVEEGGFAYDSDYYGDELPFWTDVAGKPHLTVPYTLTNNDNKFTGAIGTGGQWFELVRDAFDMLHAEGGKMMSVGLHNRLIGHPARAGALARVLDHVASRRDVWITGRADIAHHWIATHPAPG